MAQILHCCGWLWYRPAAIALTGPLAGDPPYAMGEVLKRKKKNRNVANNLAVPNSMEKPELLCQ